MELIYYKKQIHLLSNKGTNLIKWMAGLLQAIWQKYNNGLIWCLFTLCNIGVEIEILSRRKYNMVHIKCNNLKYTLSQVQVSNVHYNRPRPSIKQPTQNKEATLGFLDWRVVYPKSNYKISLPLFSSSYNCCAF